MTDPAKCHCGSISWERNIEESRYICASCKRPLWQPIETAPKDEMVLVWSEDGWAICAELVSMSDYGGYDDFGECYMWVSDDDLRLLFFPTHWMPLPEPPRHE
jgi:hypothetical protein